MRIYTAVFFDHYTNGPDYSLGNTRSMATRELEEAKNWCQRKADYPIHWCYEDDDDNRDHWYGVEEGKRGEFASESYIFINDLGQGDMN